VTRIDFYRYADDKLGFACRLATIAYEKAARLVVYSSERARLQRFDQQLWTMHATRFVPHCFLESPLAAETPIVLATAGEALPHHEVLMNLDDEWPPFFASFDRVLEIVSTDEGDKEKARARYSFYNKRGYDIQVHAVDAERKQGE
jgi:DNA polymerase III subunit chi